MLRKRKNSHSHLFSVTIGSTRWHRIETVFKAATLGESADLYRQLFEDLVRECGLHGQMMTLVRTAVTERTVGGVRSREMVSLTVDFGAAQAHGAAVALAKKAGLANSFDAARAFLRGFSEQYQLNLQRLLLDSNSADKDQWKRRLSAPPPSLRWLIPTGCSVTSKITNTRKCETGPPRRRRTLSATCCSYLFAAAYTRTCSFPCTPI